MKDSPTNLNADTVLCVAEGLDLVLLSADELLVQFGTRSYPSELFRDTDLKGIIGRTVERLLEGPATIRELTSNAGPEDQADVMALIKSLTGRGVLTDVLQDPVDQYLRYTFVGEAALAKFRVSLIGAGPLGARVAQSLLQQGLGGVTLLDDRKTDRLWHAFLPSWPEPDHETAPPAHIALRNRLMAAGYTSVKALNARLDTSGVEAAVTKSDFVVVALEQPHLRLSHLVNRLCLRQSKPWMLATIDGNLGLVGPLFLPVHTACYNDYRTLADAATPSPDMARRHRQHILGRGAGSFFPGLPLYAEIVAGHASLGVLHFLLRDTCFALGRVLVIDFDRMRIDVEDVLKLPRCPVCGIGKSAYRPPFSVDVVMRP